MTIKRKVWICDFCNEPIEGNYTYEQLPQEELKESYIEVILHPLGTETMFDGSKAFISHRNCGSGRLLKFRYLGGQYYRRFNGACMEYKDGMA